MVATLAQ